MRVGLLEVAVITSVCVLSLLGPGVNPERFTIWMLASSKTVKFVNVFIVGGSFAELIVSRNELLADTVPSLTEMVMVLVPKTFAAGVMVAVRLLPEPPKTILAFGTRAVLDEVALRINESGGVSASPITNEAAAGLSS